MEKTPCMVRIDSAFAEEGKRYPGTFESSEERIRVAWTQEEEEKGEGESRFLLSYRIKDQTLHMSRKGSAETDMVFRAGSKTEGIMRTSHGDFDLSMETFDLSFFPEEEDREVEEEGQIYLVKKAVLKYHLCFPQQEPMLNNMIFEVRLAKNEKNV